MEANGRVTGAMIPLSVAMQTRQPRWCVLSSNIMPARGFTYEEADAALVRADVRFNGTRGVLLACPELLEPTTDPGDTGKAMVYCIDQDVDGAELLLRSAQSIFGQAA
jgi:hypothetical protein